MKLDDLFAPWWIEENHEQNCYDIYDNKNDRIMTGIETLEEARLVCALPDLYATVIRISKYEPGRTTAPNGLFLVTCDKCLEIIYEANNVLQMRGLLGKSEVQG